ncbi:hypothetical protein HGB13_00300 [bacterium]|nr:hypothetical protein [bacterium]
MIKVTDPALLAELNAPAENYRQPITDQALLSQLNNDKPEETNVDSIHGHHYASHGLGKNLLYGLGNVATGMAQGVQGMRNLPYHVTNTIFSKLGYHELAKKLAQGPIGSRMFAPDTTNLSMWEPGMLGELTRNLSSVIPSIMLTGGIGGTGRAATIAGGALGGAATAGDSPFIGATIGGSGAAVAPYLISGLAKGSKYLTNELKDIPKAFKVGKYEKLPESTIEGIRDALSEHGMTKIKEPVKKLYDSVFKGFKEHELPFANATKKQYSLHDLVTEPGLAEKKVSFFDLRPSQPEAYNTKISYAVNKVHERPTLNNLHNARKIISDEAIKLEKVAAKKGGYLDTAEGNKLDYLTKAKSIIDNDIERFAEIVNPKAAGAFKAANRQWATDVEPYKSAQKTLWGIADQATPEAFAKEFTKKFASEKARQVNQLPGPIVNQVKELSKQLEDLAIAKSMRKKLLIGSGLAGGSYGLDKLKNMISIGH